jgi:ribosomal protein S4
MVLVSDNNSFHDEMNTDDQQGERVDIPSIIIKNGDGFQIKNKIKANPLDSVIMSIKFVSLQEDSDFEVHLTLFLRSDEQKALHFFKEFRDYYSKLCNNILT